MDKQLITLEHHNSKKISFSRFKSQIFSVFIAVGSPPIWLMIVEQCYVRSV